MLLIPAADSLYLYWYHFIFVVLIEVWIWCLVTAEVVSFHPDYMRCTVLKADQAK